MDTHFGSTLIGEGLDTRIFITIAFWGIIPGEYDGFELYYTVIFKCL